MQLKLFDIEPEIPYYGKIINTGTKGWFIIPTLYPNFFIGIWASNPNFKPILIKRRKRLDESIGIIFTYKRVKDFK